MAVTRFGIDLFNIAYGMLREGAFPPKYGVLREGVMEVKKIMSHIQLNPKSELTFFGQNTMTRRMTEELNLLLEKEEQIIRKETGVTEEQSAELRAQISKKIEDGKEFDGVKKGAKKIAGATQKVVTKVRGWKALKNSVDSLDSLEREHTVKNIGEPLKASETLVTDNEK